MIRRRLTTLACIVAALAAPALRAAATDGLSAPPGVAAGGGMPARAALVLPTVAAARTIGLARPDASEEAALAAYNARRGGKGQPLAIGFGRDVPSAARRVALAELAWTASADGGRVARIDVTSPGAAALRVALALPVASAGLSMRFAGTDAAFAAVSADAIAEATARAGQYWSPVLAGDSAIVELHVAAGAPVPAAALAIPRVSHQVVGGADLLAPWAKVGIGASGSCNVDVACVAPQNTLALAHARAVARLQFVRDDGRSYLCTGTLLADTTGTQTPYVLTANHCVGTASVARTLNTFWFFDAVACNSKTTPPYVHLTGGADLLAVSPDRDWSFVRLRESAPSGAGFAAWRAETLAAGNAVATAHHPQGDLKKWSTGTTTGSLLIDDGDVFGDFTEVVWNSGITEAGSSGGSLLTLAGAGYYEVRGGLYAGYSSCSRPSLPDYFSDLASALPALRPYLAPDAPNPAGLVVAVEFYHRGLDHYFVSTNPAEIANLDSGATVGWVRTGLSFLAYATQAAGTTPVCRFYRAPAYGDSHFYSASPAECAATAAAHPVDWIYESPSVFYVRLPDTATGACPAGTRAIWRYFNKQTTNHRYTVEAVVRNNLATSPLWIAEGYGPGPYFPVMCAPVA
ncbi:MAG: serine protease [Burkholderiales bacterium]